MDVNLAMSMKFETDRVSTQTTEAGNVVATLQPATHLLSMRASHIDCALFGSLVLSFVSLLPFELDLNTLIERNVREIIELANSLKDF